MKNFLFSLSLGLALLTAQAQSLRADSALSRDLSVTLNYQVPALHGQDKIRVFENNQLIYSCIAFADGTTADTATFTFPNRTAGYKIYHVGATMLGADPCSKSIQVMGNTAVQIGSAPCCQVPFADIGPDGPRRIRYRFGLCPFPPTGTQTYTVTFRRLNAYDPGIYPSLSTPIQASGNRLAGYIPSLQERGAMQVFRSSATDHGNQWYRVDVIQNQAGCTNNRVTGFVYVPN